MRVIPLFFLTCAASSVACYAAESAELPADETAAPAPGVHASPEALAASVKAAFESRRVEAWRANVVLSGVSAEDRAVLDSTLGKIFAVKPDVRGVTVDTLPDGFDRVQVAAGRKYTLTVTPVGVIRLRFAAGKSETEIALPYGRVGDGFMLGTLRSEKLNWTGPADEPFVVEIRHTGDVEGIGALIRYNASGVALEKRVSGRTRRVIVAAQRIDSVEVERTGDEGETSLEITHRVNGAPAVLYRSESLKQPGKIHFERDKDTPAAGDSVPAAATPAA